MIYLFLMMLFAIYHFVLYSKTKKIDIIKTIVELLLFLLFNTGLLYLFMHSLTFSWIALAYLLANSILFFGLQFLIRFKKQIKIFLKTESFAKYTFVFLLLFAFFYILEVSLFNIKHYTSFNNQPKNIAYDYTGMEKIDKNLYRVTNPSKLAISLKNIDNEIHHIYLKIGHNRLNLGLTITPKINDAANQNKAILPARSIMHSVPTSQYMSLHLAGKTTKASFHFSNAIKGDVIRIEKVIINPQIPLFISNIRILILTLVSFLSYLIRPHSFLYAYSFSGKAKYKNKIIAGFIAFHIVLLLILTNMNPSFKNQLLKANSQYFWLTESLAKGNVSIDAVEPSKKLKELKNPYDISVRNKNLIADVDYIWDLAYYKGNYYVYFGIVPVIILFLPYYLLFHVHIPLWFASFILASGAVLGILYFLKEIAKKWFPKITLMQYLLASTFTIWGCGLLYITKRPTIYVIGILAGIMFITTGLALLISSTKGPKKRKLKLFLASLSIALVAGCRPQLLLCLALVPLILWDDIFKKRSLFSKKSIKETLCLLLPILFVALGLMYYNWIRFGSVFDFGANYNLTTNDMTKRGFVLERIPLGIFTFLFQPTHVYPIFPFIFEQAVQTKYLGVTIAEPFFGGLIYNNIILLATLFLPKFKKLFSKKEAYYFAFICMIIAFGILIFDTEAAGILPRYISDFGFLFFTVLAMILFSIELYLKENKWKLIFRKVVLVCLALTILYQIFLMFTDISMLLANWNAKLYHSILHFFSFWL